MVVDNDVQASAMTLAMSDRMRLWVSIGIWTVSFSIVDKHRTTSAFNTWAALTYGFPFKAVNPDDVRSLDSILDDASSERLPICSMVVGEEWNNSGESVRTFSI